MARISLDDILARVEELPPSEQRELYVILGSKLSRESPRPKDRSVPLIVDQADFSREFDWLNKHRQEYAGQWVALKGDRLIACGASAGQVYAASDEAGVDMPLVTRVDDPNAPPFAGV